MIFVFKDESLKGPFISYNFETNRYSRDNWQSDNPILEFPNFIKALMWTWPLYEVRK